MKKVEKKEVSNHKGVRSFPTYNINPFLDNLNVTSEDKKVIVQPSIRTENSCDIIVFHKEHDIFGKFNKVLEEKFNLTSCAVGVLSYLRQQFFIKQRISKVNKEKSKEEDNELLTNIDEYLINIDCTDCMNYMGYSSVQSVFNGLSELLDVQFIARSHNNNVYHLNPNIFLPIENLSITENYGYSPIRSNGK